MIELEPLGLQFVQVPMVLEYLSFWRKSIVECCFEEIAIRLVEKKIQLTII